MVRLIKRLKNGRLGVITEQAKLRVPIADWRLRGVVRLECKRVTMRFKHLSVLSCGSAVCRFKVLIRMPKKTSSVVGCSVLS